MAGRPVGKLSCKRQKAKLGQMLQSPIINAACQLARPHHPSDNEAGTSLVVLQVASRTPTETRAQRLLFAATLPGAGRESQRRNPRHLARIRFTPGFAKYFRQVPLQ